MNVFHTTEPYALKWSRWFTKRDGHKARSGEKWARGGYLNIIRHVRSKISALSTIFYFFH